MDDTEKLHSTTWHAALRRRRVDLGMSLRDVEYHTGVSNAYISQMERGLIQSVSFFKLMRILDLYDINPVTYALKFEVGSIESE